MHCFLVAFSILSLMQCVFANINRCEVLVRIAEAWRWKFKEHVEDKLLVSYVGLHVRGNLTVFLYRIVWLNIPKLCVISYFFFPCTCNGGVVI